MPASTRTIVLVYPGVTTAAGDKQSNGSFHSGDTVVAVCKLEGRTIISA